MSETRTMDGAVRVREMNDARDKIGGEPFLRGDDAIKDAFEFGLCQELVLGTYDGDAKWERERISAEKQRIADSNPAVKQQYHHSNRYLSRRTTYQSKVDGGERHGLREIYHENRNLFWKHNYKDGKQDGLSELYHDNGELHSTSCYDNGEEVDMSYCEQ
jgi:hypothetical protein